MFEKIKEIYAWLMANYENLFYFLGMIGVMIESFFRLIPTKNPSSALEKIGSIIKKIMDFFKIPNVKAKEDSKFYLPKPDGLHPKDEQPKS